MNTDNKTLADVKPGGRVRLGDQAERARFEAWGRVEGLPLARGKLGGYAFEVTAKAWRAWQHLSAQPSPGGQDALVREALDYFERAGDAGDRKYVAAIRAALAARQPVTMDDALAAGDGTLHGAIDHWQERALRAEAELAARQPVGEPVAVVVPGAPTRCRHCESTDLEWFAHVRAVNDVPHGRLTTHDVGCVFVLGCNECSETLHTVKADAIAPILAAKRAQAVDLADFKALYRAYVRLLESGRDRIRDLGGTCDPVDVMEANDVDLQAARRVIDSQAVGNG